MLKTMVQYRDPGPIFFDAVIERPDGPGAYVTFPFSALEAFGLPSTATVPTSPRATNPDKPGGRWRALTPFGRTAS